MLHAYSASLSTQDDGPCLSVTATEWGAEAGKTALSTLVLGGPEDLRPSGPVCNLLLSLYINSFVVGERC